MGRAAALMRIGRVGRVGRIGRLVSGPGMGLDC